MLQAHYFDFLRKNFGKRGKFVIVLKENNGEPSVIVWRILHICKSGQDILGKFEAAKEELKRLHEIRGKEAMFRSKMKWIEQGEKPTKYFHNLENINYEKKIGPRGETRK